MNTIAKATDILTKDECAAILAEFEGQGVYATDVAKGLDLIAKAKALVTEKETTTSQQAVVITLTVDTGKKSRANIAKESGLTPMTIGRYYAAGLILIAHPQLDAPAVVTYANTHTQDECKAVAAMSEEDAASVITPKKEKSQKSEAEKDLAAVEALLKRIRKAGEEGDRQRVEALDAALTMLTEALPEAYAASEEGAESEAV